MRNKILVTGGNGRFAKVLKKRNNLLNLKFLSKKEMNILNIKSIEKCITKHKPKILIHTAGLSRPMQEHEINISKSIDLNIIGTANIVKACEKHNIKLIYFSTCYVYDGIKGNFNETDPVKPINNYALSKLGGESSVLMYKNSLVLRIQMTEKPFFHKKAFTNLFSNYIFHDEMADILPKLLNSFGIINVGGKLQSIYNFAKQHNTKIIKDKCINKKIPLKQTMNLSKLKKILN
ncbi:sugar nucleotide-binding protein [Pelagibacterales bacterium SAG-MED50]|nr:sugar nucleotide-binding protein [Pelagibacterales bacterium SAG-MED50]